MSTYPDTLLVDGVTLEACGFLVTDLSGLFAPGTRRGDDDVIPGRRGAVGAELPYDAYQFSIPVALLSAEPALLPRAHRRAVWVDKLRTACAVFAGNNGLVTLTRRLSTETAGPVDHTCAGRFITGTTFEMLNAFNGTTELQFINLDGAWFDAVNDEWLVP
jgi:hypothetical protein